MMRKTYSIGTWVTPNDVETRNAQSIRQKSTVLPRFSVFAGCPWRDSVPDSSGVVSWLRSPAPGSWDMAILNQIGKGRDRGKVLVRTQVALFEFYGELPLDARQGKAPWGCTVPHQKRPTPHPLRKDTRVSEMPHRAMLFRGCDMVRLLRLDKHKHVG
jgi:hypothetical protein